MFEKITVLVSNRGFIRYFTNTSWLLAERVLRLIVGLFVVVWVARYLGPERFGLFSYAQSFVGLFSIIATLGLDNIVIRELVKRENSRDVLLGTAFCLKVFGAIFVFFLLGIAVLFTSNDGYTNVLIFIIASAILFQSFNVIDFYFMSKVLSKYVVFANTICLVISSLLKIIGILLQAPLIFFAFLVFLDSAVLAAGLVFFYRRNQLSMKSWTFDRNTAKELLKNSIPLILSGLLVAIHMKIDQVMIKEMLDSNSVGQYAAAVRISEAWYFIPSIFFISFFPAILNAKKNNETLFYSRLQYLYDLMVWLAIIVALLMTFLSDYIVCLLFGPAYNQAAKVLVIHIWAGIFVSVGGVNQQWYLSENLQPLLFWKTFCAVIANLLLNTLLIPSLGIKGAAIATLISYSIGSFFFEFFLKTTRHIFFMKLQTLNLKRLLDSLKNIKF
jgi:O-antigen/teichoic acid export membrane protein